MHIVRFGRFLVTGLAIAAALGALAGIAGAQIRYPRLGVPGAIHGNGVPYLDSLGALNTSVIDVAARFDQIVIDASPITEYDPQILAALRARNPDLKAIAYVVGGNIWTVDDADSTVHFPTRYYHMVRNLNGFLYDRAGNYYPEMRNNLAKRDGSGHYVVAEAEAQLFYDAIASTGLWDGLFVDVYCDDITWSQTPAESIDFVRAGYPNQAAFAAAWRAGTDTLASKLRRLVGPDFILMGNCAVGSKYAWFNGWTRENFPYQGGGSWQTNMFNDPGGYFVDEARFRAPTRNHIFSWVSGTNPYTSDNARRVRYGLGSASLGTGVATFGPSDRSTQVPPHDTWWYDEYSVDVATGQSVADRAHTGWLGQALGAPYQQIWAGSNPDASTNPDFETDVTSGWTFSVGGAAAATLSRDVSTAAVGSASAHVAVTTAGTLPWNVSFNTANRITLVPYNTYAITFWAKASTPRVLTMDTPFSPGSSGGSATVSLTTQWKHYQALLTPTAGGNATLTFYLGTQTGETWFDDVHFQQGATNVWRRDFENGSVLVNPSSFTLSVPLGATMRRIAGSVDPLVNNGATSATATLGPESALFLLTSSGDVIPPAAITDVRLMP
jgi:hypothetical protein